MGQKDSSSNKGDGPIYIKPKGAELGTLVLFFLKT